MEKGRRNLLRKQEEFETAWTVLAEAMQHLLGASVDKDKKGLGFRGSVEGHWGEGVATGAYSRSLAWGIVWLLTDLAETPPGYSFLNVWGQKICEGPRAHAHGADPASDRGDA